MTKPLQLSCGFGASLADAYLLAHQIDESEDDGGHRRSFVLRVEGGRARISELLPRPAYQAWRSSNGHAYVSSEGGEVWIHDGRTWSRERVTEEEVQLGPIWGISGVQPSDDSVFVATDRELHVRSGGRWRAHAIDPRTEMVLRLHGLGPTAMYMTTGEGLWCFDGVRVRPDSGPERPLSGVRVLADERSSGSKEGPELIVTGQALFRRGPRGWQTLVSPGGQRHTIAVETFAGRAHVGSATGVLRVDGEVVTRLSEGYCNCLIEVGDHLIASGDEVSIFDGQTWRPLELPLLERDGVPRIG